MRRERRTIISRYSLSPLSLSYFSSVQIFIVDCGGAVTAATNTFLFCVFKSRPTLWKAKRRFIFDKFSREKYIYLYFEEKFEKGKGEVFFHILRIIFDLLLIVFL